MKNQMRIRNRRVKDEKVRQIIDKKYSSANQSLNLGYFSILHSQIMSMTIG
jgi:hypothetical protein